MKVLVVEPGYAPYEKDIEGLHGMQEVVGGTITAIYPFAEPVAVVGNDDSNTIAGPARGPMSRNAIIALPKSLIRGASGITSAPWYWNSLCFKTSSASLPTFRRTRMSLRSLSCETKPQRKRQSRCRPDAF